MLRELLASFGFDFDATGSDAAFGSIDGLIDGLGDLKSAFLDNELIQGVITFTGEMVETASAIAAVSTQIDQSTDQVQQWGSLFSSVGLDIDEVGDVIASLQERARDAKESDDVREMFKSIGVSVLDANGELKDANTLFRETVGGMSRMTNATDRAGLALTLLGDNGRRLIPILEGGTEGLDAAAAEFDRLGGGLSGRAIDATKGYTSAMSKLDAVVLSLKSSVVEFLIPAIAGAVDIAAEGINDFREWAEGTRVLEIAFVLLAAVTAAWAINTLIAFAPVIATFALIAFVVSLIVLVIDDLITAFEGGESVIGEFIDSMFGIGTTEDVVKRLKKTWEEFFTFWSEVIEEAGPAWDAFTDRLGATWTESVEFWSETWDTFTANLTKAWGEFSDFWGEVITDIGNTWDAFTERMARGAGRITGGLASVASALGFDDLASSLGGGGTVTGAAPAGGGSSTSTATANTFNISGSDPEEIARQVRDVVTEQNMATIRELSDQTSRRVQ